ncbi:MAG: hypothetical protein J1E97_00090 [Muribaculaceae bacterium]|nr:hypothetical protein [Muribaculaceae bacterium]
MRKKVLALALGMFAFCSIGAMAQTEASASAKQQTEKCCKSEKGEKKDCKKGDKKGDKKHGKRHGEGRMDPFAGIQLTPAQMEQLEQLKAEQKKQREADKKDKAAAREQSRKAYSEKVAQILTPEQLAQYQANCDSIKANKMNKRKARMHGEKKQREKKENK